MQFNTTLFEAGVDIVPDQNNVNIGTGGGALTGAWVSAKGSDRLYFVVKAPPGSSGDHIVISPLQATSVAGAGSKALTVSKIWSKVGTTSASSDNAVGTWTLTELTTPSSALSSGSVTGQQYTSNGTAGSAVSAQNLGADTKAATLIVEVRADSLDANNGFCFVSAGLSQVATGATRTVSTMWITKADAMAQGIPVSKLS